jgi:uncharacterized membrane protein
MKDMTWWHSIKKIGKDRPAALWISAIALLLFTSISLVNHYFFRTYSFDLGLFNQAMYDYRSFRFSDTGTFTYTQDNFLADHFDLYLIIFSPLSYLLGSSTLLWVQIFSLLLGSWGVYRFVRNKQADLALPAMIGFLSFYGIYTALAFDYHSNVVAAASVPWFFLSMQQRKFTAALAWFLWILAGKETMALWMGVVVVCMAWEYRKDKKALQWLGLFWFLAVVWFLVIHGWVLPSLNSQGYAHFKYKILGETPLEALQTLITQPAEVFSHFLHNHTGAAEGHGIKEETQKLLLLSGAWLLVFRPAYLGMLVPLVFMKFFHNETKTWSICYHYSIEFAPILAIGGFSVLSGLKQPVWRKAIGWFVVASTMVATGLSMAENKFYCGEERHRFYTVKHWHAPYDIGALKEGLSSIPSGARVSANAPLVPRLAFRDHIYCYPIVKDAEYVVFSLGLPPYPLTWEENIAHCKKYYSDTGWELSFVNKEIRIFRRKGN